MITNFFIPELKNHDVQELWCQQDGATCHTARATIDLLKDTFGDRLISRFGPVNWPPRSCDLTPLDIFCGAVSDRDFVSHVVMVGVTKLWVRVLVPLKTRHVEELMYTKSVKTQSPPFGMMWNFENGDTN
ncbi:hypothetical protein TNCV_4470661 [Trichonephila clavipes]|uniref:Transposase n=1 Tax=Trichonephila clavipes TaxID=2585209 RepID=A0A8X6SGM6_TRICX|nr:hypothetical protein TNCV_4470661 [Trichonephila clavipes]